MGSRDETQQPRPYLSGFVPQLDLHWLRWPAAEFSSSEVGQNSTSTQRKYDSMLYSVDRKLSFDMGLPIQAAAIYCTNLTI